MEKISCYIARDLLPLYIDGVLSAESTETVKAHLDECENCRESYGMLMRELSLPTAQKVATSDVGVLRKFKRRWNFKKLIIALISVLLTATVIVNGYMVYENVTIVHDFFTPTITVTMRNDDKSDEWQRLDVGESGFLVFNSMFYRKEVVLDGNCDDAVLLRISDTSGNVIMNNIIIKPGTSFDLSLLEDNTEYVVKIKTAATYIVLRFV